MREFLFVIVLAEIVMLLIVLRIWWKERKPKNWRPDRLPEINFYDEVEKEMSATRMEKTKPLPPTPPESSVYKPSKK